MDREIRARRLALRPWGEPLETRQMLSGDVVRGLSAPRSLPLAVESAEFARPVALNALAWTVLRDGLANPERPMGPLAESLGRYTVGDVTRTGAGRLLLRELRAHPGMAASAGLGDLARFSPMEAESSLRGLSANAASASSRRFPSATRPDLEAFAWKLASKPGFAAREGLTVLSRLLRGCRLSDMAESGLGSILARELGRRPVYAARHGLTGLIAPPSSPDPAIPVEPPPGDGPGDAVDPPPVILASTIQVGSTFSTTIPTQDLAGSNLTFTITPQPLPANMSFNRQTGELVFAPDLDQVGEWNFQVGITGGGKSASYKLALTVSRISRPSTEVSGRVVDEAGRPLAKVPVRIGESRTTTAEDGSFLLENVAADAGPLVAEGQSALGADRLTVMAPTPRFLGHPIRPGVENAVRRPIVLPSIDLANATDFSAIDAQRDLELTSPKLPGVTLNVAGRSAKTRSGEAFTGKLALTPLSADQLREVLPPGIVPGFMVGVDGPDLRFETPARITLPNPEGYRPGSVLELRTMNMTTGGFDVTGHLQVSEDGRRIETVAGGIYGSTCLFAVPRPPGLGEQITNCRDCENTAETDSEIGLITGTFYEAHALVAYSSQGRERGIVLEYSSQHADPTPIIQMQPRTQAASLSEEIESVGVTLSAGGVGQGFPVTYDTPNGLANGHVYRIPLRVDGTSMSTGVHSFQMGVTQYFDGGAALGRDYTGGVDVVNASASPYGAGWSVGGLQRVHTNVNTNMALVTAGSRGSQRFTFLPAAAIQDLAIVRKVAVGMSYVYELGLQLNDENGLGEFGALGDTIEVSEPAAIVAGDFDGDDEADIALVGGTALEIYLADGAGGFTAGNTYTLADDGAAILAGDFTGHGNSVLDLAVLRDDGVVTVYTGNGSGGFGSPTSTTVGGGSFTGVGSMAAGDFDGDDDLDLAVATTGDGKLRTLLGNGSGGFGTATVHTSISSTAAAVGDLTGDGDLDLAVIRGYSGLIMMIGDGSGGFTAGGEYDILSTTRPGFSSVAIGDFYGDGQLAAAITANDTEAGVIIVPGDASGSWGNPTLYPDMVGATFAYTALVASDLNSDAKPDLALANRLNATKLLPTDRDTNQMRAARQVGESVPYLIAAAPFSGRALSDRYVGSASETSKLALNQNGTWTRTYTDGTVIDFDSSGRQVAETDRNGNATTFTYIASGAAAGALQSVIDPVGLRTTLAYNGSGKLSTITDPAGRVTTFVMDGSGNLTSITDPDGAASQYGYSTPSNHRITSETSPRGHTATIAYDSYGRVLSETLFDGKVVSIVYGAGQGLVPYGTNNASLPSPDGFVGSVTDPNSRVTTLAFNTMGHPKTVRDALDNLTTFTYNENGWVKTIVDPMSRTTSYSYDDHGNVAEIVRPGGTSMSATYHSTFGAPTRITDYLGRITTFTLDSEGNVTRRTDPDLDYEDYTYNAAGQLLTVTDRNGHTTSIAYDSLGRATTITYPGAGTPQVVLTYDSAGNVTRVLDELGRAVTFTYDQANRLKTSENPIEAAAGKRTTYTYDASGNLTGLIDALDRITTLTYDARGRRTGVTNPLNLTMSYAYDNGGNLIATTDPLGHATTYTYDNLNRIRTVKDALNRTTTYTYDAASQVTQITDANNNTTTFAYDSLGRMTTVTYPGTADNGSGTQIAVRVVRGYDANGNLTTVKDGLDHVATYVYDNLDRLIAVTDPLSHTTSFGYDAVGNRTTITDPLSHVTTLAYDVRNRLISQTAPSGGGTTTYTYDAHSRLTSLTDPVGNVTSYTYDDGDRLTVETDPRGKRTTYAYDVVNNPTQKVDRLGRILDFGYDAADRLVTETWRPSGGGSALRIVTYTYDNADRLTGIVDPDSQYAYGYDEANQLTTVNNQGTPGLPQVTLTYGYDNVGNRASLTDTKNGITSYTYDERNELTRITQSGTGISAKRVDFAYDAAMRRTTLTRYSDLAGTQTVLVTKYAYDVADRLTTLTHQTGGGTVRASYGYTLDAASRLTSEARAWNSGSSTDTVTYGYTNDDQLTSVTHTNTSFANESFSFDVNGNRTMSGYSTATGNRLSSDGVNNYTYDDEGNLLDKTVISSGNKTLYTWDHRNRLTAVDSNVGATTTRIATYTYDAMDRRIKVVANGATRYTLYDGPSALLDFDNAGAVTARYLQGPVIDEILARETSSGVAWYLPDRLGTIRDLSDNSGAIVDHIDYGVFGAVLAESAPSVGDRWKYTGRELDSETGLYQYRSRYYDAGMGRFISEDTIGFGGGDANLYRYVGNGPSDGTDPFGLYDEDFHFYVTYYLAVMAGLGKVSSGYLINGKPASEAYVIAWSAQYVDDNSRTGPIEPFWNSPETKRENYHFPWTRTATGRQILPACPNSQTIANYGVSTQNPFIFGIGVHVLQDSSSHSGKGVSGTTLGQSSHYFFDDLAVLFILAPGPFIMPAILFGSPALVLGGADADRPEVRPNLALAAAHSTYLRMLDYARGKYGDDFVRENSYSFGDFSSQLRVAFMLNKEARISMFRTVNDVVYDPGAAGLRDAFNYAVDRIESTVCTK